MRKHKAVDPDKKLALYGMPKRIYKYGYSYKQIQECMSAPEYKRFCHWMDGQTCVLEKGQVVVYAYDILRFLEAYRKNNDVLLSSLID